MTLIKEVRRLFSIEPPANYFHTNESLDAIMVGLEPNEKDKIFAVEGSGDQVFALLELGSEVFMNDINPSQIEYIEFRVDLIKKG